MTGTCPVCEKADVPLERHHLAPRNLFGAEAERWPTVDVCRPCHERWHAKVDRTIEAWRNKKQRERAMAAMRRPFSDADLSHAFGAAWPKMSKASKGGKP